MVELAGQARGDIPDGTDEIGQVAALLNEAGETHHIVDCIVDGNDPNWASWYPDWLGAAVTPGRVTCATLRRRAIAVARAQPQR